MELYKKLFGYAPEKRGLGIAAVILAALSSAALIAPFRYLWNFLYAVTVNGDNSEAWRDALIIAGLLVAYMLIYFASLMCSHLFAFRIESNLRRTGLKHLLKASFSFFDTASSGRVRKIIDDNAAQTHMILAHLMPDITVAVVVPVLMYALMFFLDWQLGILLVTATIIALLLMKLMYGERKFMEIYQKALERLNSEAVEYVRGMQVIKIFRATIDSYKSLYNAIKEYSEMAYNYTKSCRIGFVLFQVILSLFITATIPLAIIFLNKGADPHVILVKIIFFACFEGLIFLSFMKIMWVGMYQFQAKNAVDKLESLFSDMESKKLSHGTETQFANFDIAFQNVSFKYDETDILKDLSFSLEAGKTYALVGSSGGGKSTIAKLISGFYSIDGGEIRIGGKNIASYSEDALVKNIAFVFQNAKLFKASIFENVRMARPEATKDEVMEALHLAQCDDILAKFAERENTMIGSQGVHLSGGETQRIAVARVILKNASIVILDEASAAADPENEYELQKAFSNMMKGKTVIMIAHRLSSIKNVDEILVVEHGKIIERGSDRELSEQGGKYSQLQKLYAQANSWQV